MLQVKDHADVRELRLDRPPANALSPELVAALLDAVRAAPREGARALVLSGAPGMFSAGLDVPVLLPLDRAAIDRTWTDFYALMKALAASPIPVAAAITGHSPAGGAVLSLFCDRRFMARGADGKSYKIGLNEVQVGIPMPPAIYRAVTLVVGFRQAARLTSEGLLIPGDEAHRIGLIDELLADDEVVDAAIAWCRGVLALPQGAMRTTRAMARSAIVELFGDGREEVEQTIDSWFSDETQAVLAAMVENLKKKR